MIWFDRRLASGLTATLELRVRPRTGRRSVPFTVQIADGRVRVRPGAPRNPVAQAAIGAGDLVRLATGRATWPQLLSSGRLTFSGDPFVVLRLPTLFRLRAG